jgi:catechol 2,3-dioxygenase-like lactoylglutathione lyase family enzyme
VEAVGGQPQLSEEEDLMFIATDLVRPSDGSCDRAYEGGARFAARGLPKARRSAWIAGLLALVCVALAQPADAAWPGTNGHIAFESNIPGSCCERVYTVDPNGSNLAEIFVPGNGPLSISEYSPDGKTILVNSSNLGSCSGANPILALVDDGLPQSGLTVLDDPSTDGDVSGLHCTRDGPGVYSLDGARIAFARSGSVDASRNGVWVMNADGSSKLRAAAASDPDDVRWSFDGTQLSYRDGGTLYVVSADGSGTPTPSFSEFPPSPGQISTWSPASGDGPATSSPDGSKQLFLHCCYADTDGVAQVNVADADGGNVQRITNFTACPGEFCDDPSGAKDLDGATWQPIPIADPTPPVIASGLNGSAGTNGWFTSAVTLTWTTSDAESGIFYTQGCDPTTVSSETAGTSFSCLAINRARLSNRASVSVKVDLTDPSVDCIQPAPVFFQGQTRARVGATVSDSLSGPLSASVSGPADTAQIGSFEVNLIGHDKAGRSMTVACGYTVKRVAIGETDLGPGADSNPAGLAEAFSAKAKTSGSLTTLSLYVDPSSSATSLIAGIYADNGNQPGSLLARGTLIGSPVKGAWNTVSLPSVPLTAGTRYWIAILSPLGSGTLRFRDFCCASSGTNPTETSTQTNLTTLPAGWAKGTRYRNDGPLTAWAG